MSIGELLTTLQDLRISLDLDAEGKSLIIKANKGAITEEIKTSLIENKQELIAFLRSASLMTGNVHEEGNHASQNRVLLSPEMLPLIDLTQQDIDCIVGQIPGGAENIQDIYALSPSQEGILFHHLMNAEGDPYLIRTILSFTSRSLLDRFLAAAQKVVDRHDILRTSFVWEKISMPAQVVWRKAQLSIDDFIFDPAAGSLEEQLASRFDPRQQHIDLGKAPLLQFATAYDPDHNRWLVLQTLHHLIGDHSTLEVLKSEVAVLLAGQEDLLPKPKPFRNLVVQSRLGATVEEHERFFRHMLADVDEPTLAFGIGDIYQDGGDIAEFRQMLPQDLNHRLRRQARRLGVSLASLCHVAWGQILASITGNNTVICGTVLLGRMQGNSTEAVGLFINTLPMRLDLGEAAIEHVVQQTHVRLADLLVHEHASLALAQRCSISGSAAPLFNTVLNYRYGLSATEDRAALANDNSLAGIEVLRSEVRNNYPITMSVDDYGEGLGLVALVTRSVSAKSICGYMQQALESLALALETAPHMPAGLLEVVPRDERHLQLETWNTTTSPYPQETCVHQLFEQHARWSPTATALVFGNEILSYAELNCRANQLAHHLIELGVRPDDRVAICVDRSPAMVVGLLAILKAGGAYVPLDPAYASERLVQVLIDAAPQVLLCDVLGRQTLEQHLTDGLIVLDLDGPLSAWSSQPESNPALPELTSRHLAYVIYTSGSTGTPKGVMIEHRSAMNFHQAMAQSIYHDFFLPLRIGWNASFSFDMSLKGFLQLLSGHCLVIIPQQVRASGSEMMTFLREQKIDAFDTTPSQLKMLIAEGLLEDAHPRTVLLGGEPVDAAMWADLSNSGSVTAYNMYGPTECTVDATITPITAADEIPHIGSPIMNMRIYLLDRHRRPVPLGAAGEVYIGGAGVARGYLNRPELTAERFLADPFCDEPEARMYKTGDLARYLPDGNLVYMGRNDQQVKIRGFRIELGEIETRLTEHPLVEHPIVIAREDTPGDKRLVAYYTGDESLTAEQLRTHLTSLLPEYMIPSAFVHLETVPLTPNGKLDRKALPAPEGDAFAAHAYEPPQGETETALAEIWKELLHLERVGRNDNFFELGGHSLLAIQLIQRLRQRGLHLEIRVLFTTPKLMDLAASLRRSATFAVPPNLIQLDSGVITPDMLPLIDLTQDDIDHIVEQIPGGVSNIQDIYALSPSQEGILFHHLMADSGDPYLMSTALGFRDRALLDRFLQAVQQVVNRHDILRTSFIWKGLSVPAQVVWRRAQISITELEFDPRDGQIVDQLTALFDPRSQNMDLTKAPLLQLFIARDPEHSRWILLRRLHHLVGDQSTLHLLRAEVAAILSDNQQSLAFPVPFRNLVAQSRLGVSVEEHERFFRNMLGDLTEPTLPFGISNVHQDGRNVTESRLMLPGDLDERLRQQARRLGVSVASLCHLAWAEVLASITSTDRVVFGTVLFGRMQGSEGTDQTVGLLVNTLPISVDLGEASTEAAVRKVHSSLAELLAHEHASLALAQRCSGIEATTPLFSAVFNYRYGGQVTSSEIGSSSALMEIELLGHEWRTNYPLTLSVEDFGNALGLLALALEPASSERICAYTLEALERITQALEAGSQVPVRQINIVPSQERKLLLEAWNRTPAPSADKRCIHQVFEEQVRKNPEAVALVFGGDSLSYAQLNHQANRLARYLIGLGVVPDDRIAICVDRSLAMVIGVLAILKAGAAYVPLDPAYPSERLSQTLSDASPRLLLCDALGRQTLESHLADGLVVLELDAPQPVWSSQPETDPEVAGLTSRHLAYVIYTSGSTGTPKGVMVEHAQITRLFEVTQDSYGFSDQDVWCLFHSFAFDFSVWEIWGALRYGGRLVIVPYEVTRSTGEFYRLVCEQQVTVLNQTPSAFRALMEAEAESNQSDRLRYVIFGGEALDPTILRSWYRRRSEEQPLLVNMYGITETTVHVTYRQLTADDAAISGSPIGKRLADLRIYLLDNRLQPVPLGAAGEMYVGGAGVARGYLNRPELTAERFLVDPFCDEPGARMYKTGDLARYLPDGNLEFLGRNDQQVKIRGFRIELGEIEARLAEHPLVKHAVVIAREDIPGDKRLAAYYTTSESEALTAEQLRTHLSALLPEYMVPAAFMHLETLPLTHNGKLDRKALPAPEGDAYATHAYEPPQGEKEIALAEVWKNLLHVDRVGRNDNFFELGGHSLLAIQVIEHMRRINLHIEIRNLFTHPVLRDAATVIDRDPAIPVPPNLIRPGTRLITPNMLPLIDLTQQDIDHLVQQIPGGVANIQDIYALSPLQEGILFHHLFAEQHDPYILSALISFADRSLLDRFLSAMQRVIDRHDILRTSFLWEGISVPAQVVWKQAPLHITEIELDPLDGAAEAQLSRYCNLHKSRMDLTKAPLLHFVVAREDGSGRWLALHLRHHLIEDAVSVHILRSELQAIMENRGASLLPAEPFRNFVAQSRGIALQEAHEKFFREMLGSVTEATFPFGLDNVYQHSNRILRSRSALPRTLNDRLRAQARRLGVTLASLCHLAWGQVLARSNASEHVIFGTVLFGRALGEEGTSQAVGMFINTLPVVLDLDDQTVEDAVLQTHSKLAEVLKHEHASLALAQRCSGIKAPLPLFSAVLNYRHNPISADEYHLNESHPFKGIEWKMGENRTNYPLVLAVDDFSTSLELAAEVLAPFSAERICDYVQQALVGLADALETEPQMPIRMLEVIPNKERELLLETWNTTEATFPQHLCIHQIFEDQVSRTPEAVALLFGNESLTYMELNHRANRLAHRLIGLGVGPDERVAICLDRSPAMVVGLLATLKAGGAYVPLDPSYPSKRLAQMLTDAAPRVLLCDGRGRIVLEEHTPDGLAVLDLDTPTPSWSTLPETNPQVIGLSSGHLAYVIFTSGSTGKPKGVMIEHRSLCNHVHWQAKTFSFTQEDIFLQRTAISFDASVWELWTPLAIGARLILLPSNLQRDPDGIAKIIADTHVTVAQFVPSLLEATLRSGGFRCRYLFCGGEPLSAALVGEARRHASEGVINLYGPTEATIDATYWYLRDHVAPEVIPIGRPILNTRIYLLDSRRQPVPLGATGEIYIGGAGVARGYLSLPELTAERFLADPFRSEPGARMYKTGDLARYLPDGNLVFLGRNDQQVKIRGFRIELGEIEARLAEYPLVGQTVVIAREDKPGDKRLVAYYTRCTSEGPTTEELRTHLTAQLPEYMVPSAFVHLEVLPLTPNGKLDRRALPAPEGDAYATHAYEAPQGETEIALVEVWKELLHIDRVGRNDNFFELGGHSLLAVRLLSRLAQKFEVHIPLAKLFAAPTLAQMGTAIYGSRAQGDQQSLPSISRLPEVAKRPLSYGQQRLWFLSQLEGASPIYHIPVAVRLLGDLDTRALHHGLDTIFARHEALRSIFVTIDGETAIELLPEAMGLPLSEVDVSDKPDAQDRLINLFEQQVRAAFDLSVGPLVRACLIHLRDQEHVLILVMHHIVSDGWSMGLLVRELSVLYTAYLNGEPNPLPPLEIQYPDYAAWQRQWLTGERLETQVDYWKKALADAPPLLDLPTDRPRPPQQSFAGAQIPVRIDAELTKALKALSAKHGTTLFMTLLAAWAAVLSRLSGQEDLVIGTPVANRRHIQVENLIGFFVNTLALRIDLSGNPTVEELLRRVRIATLEAQDHQDLPFEQVVEIINPPRRLDHTPIFQVFFAWQNEQYNTADLPGIRIETLNFSRSRSRFDLELALAENSGETLGSLTYSTTLFDEATALRHIGYLTTLLKVMAISSEERVGSTDLLSEKEREMLLETWNKTNSLYPKELCIHHLFEAQAFRSPNAKALTFENQSLSYKELNDRANRLAHSLIELGVTPGVRVAICVSRSPEMVVGLLAILKAGGAYVPIDPAYPSERLVQILADAEPRVLMCDALGRRALGSTAEDSHIVIDLSKSGSVLSEQPSTNSPSAISGIQPEHLAYVIYTSGSTGRPKGVMIEHRSVVNFISSMKQLLDFREGDRLLAITSISFDISGLELYLPLAVGGEVLLASQSESVDPDALQRILSTNQVHLMQATPAAWQSLIDRGWPGSPEMKILCGGEALTTRLATNLVSRSSELWNMYGPTETTIWSTCDRIRSSYNDRPFNFQPIGRPIANTRIYLLNGHRQPVPLGAVGELYIGGAGVARGYLNRPDLTSERFVVDSFSVEPVARMYRTGDMARYLSDGNLEFLGRNDHQVKIRGFRIEMGEIEARLIEHPLVEQAVVATREDVPGDKRLIAYYTGDASVTAEQLRAYLAELLPEYMIPSAFMRLDVLPLTPNGKLDRKALPAPEGDAYVTHVYEPPQGETETTLAEIWEELLHVDRVGRNDNFFELGGHSLLVIQVVQHLQRKGLRFEVRSLFTHPVLHQAASEIGKTDALSIPPNLIKPDSGVITPGMLPLIELTQNDIDRIVEQVHGGVTNIQDIYALSPLQEGILFHHLMAENGDPYLIRTMLSFASRPLLDRFISAVQKIVDRHDILRTSFVWEGISSPAQVVWCKAEVPIDDFKFNPAAGSIKEQLAGRFDSRRHRIDLGRAPLLHFAAAYDPDHDRWLVLQTLHHLIGDHSTLEVLRAEVAAVLADNENTLAPPKSFRNLVAQSRMGVTLGEHERFFQEMLGDITEPTLPFGIGDIYQDGGEIADFRRTLPQELNDRLRRQARKFRVSLAGLCHLAWGRVLSRVADLDTVVFGTVLFGRMQEEAGSGPAIGMFINTLPVRLDFSDVSVETAVQQVHTRLSELLVHEHASLSLAQHCSNVDLDTPLFSSVFNYRYSSRPRAAIEKSSEWQEASLAGIEVLGSEVRNNYPITMSVDDYGDALGLVALVARSVSAERVCDYMQQALENLVLALETVPQMPVGLIDVIPPDERALLLERWNLTVNASADDTCIHQRFEEQARTSPGAQAVTFEGEALGYAELNCRANQLAHHLIELGIRPDDRVAICVDRSPEMVIGLLAILKAGGAYVPLDPTYPSERLAQVLDDAAPRVLLCDALGRAVLGTAATNAYVVLDLDALRPAWSFKVETDPQVAGLTSHHLAYVIYTSGSTGTPKGVMVEHRSAMNFHQAMAATIYSGFSSQLRIGWNASFSFDMSLKGFLQLLSGHCLVIIPQQVRASGAEMIAFLRQEEIDAFDTTPSQMKLLIGEGLLEDLHPRTVLLGGEPVDAAMWAELSSSNTVTAYNMYGPTECTVDATITPITAAAGPPHIGIPIMNMRIYLLDNHRQPVPLGATGEIHIGGVGVARGYLNRPELTTERFLVDPFSDEPEARMYKTGDLARYLPDGNLEFLGRNDQQVKIRGFRIELGEIETQLAAHPLVEHASVIAREDAPGDKRLVAYYTGDKSLTAEQLRSHLSALLPEYMVPVAFVHLETLPLTPNGKLDRKALPIPEGDAYASHAYEPPQGETEITLAEIWQELLHVERVGRNDNFFELGGHSLLAIQLIQRLRQRELNLEIRVLFTTPKLADLAISIRPSIESTVPPNSIHPDSKTISPEMLPLIELTQQDIDRIVEQVPGGVANIQDIYALSPLQEGILFHHLINDTGDPYLQSTRLSFKNRNLLEQFLSAVQQVIDRHDILRTSFVWEGISTPAQVVWRKAFIPVTELELDPALGPIEEQLVRRFDPRKQRINLSTPPLLHFAVTFDSGNNRWLAVQTLHHLVGDHSTQDVLRSEVTALLNDLSAPLPAPKPFRNLIAQSRVGMKAVEHERFFREMLGDISEPTLPFGITNVYQDGSNIAESQRRLPSMLNDRLRLQARRLGVSLASLCHVAWGRVLERITGSSKVVFGTVLFGRMQGDAGSDQATGMFINTLPVRFDLGDTPSEETIRQAHSRLSKLLTHEHASLSLAQRSSGVNVLTPLFNTVLNYRYSSLSPSTAETTPVNTEHPLAGIEILGREVRNNYPITMSVDDYGEALGLVALVTRSVSAERICGYMQQALESLTQALETSPKLATGLLEVIPAEERELMLEKWNATTSPYPGDTCIHQLFEQEAQCIPEAPALVSENETLSYAALNRQANRLAHHLIGLGVMPDDRVAICVDRSPQMVIGLLAILKAGGAYVPLDPAYPSERLVQVLRDAIPRVLLCDVLGRQTLGNYAIDDLIVLDLDAPRPAWSSKAETDPQVAGLTSHHLAYVIYTSGSTGTPKGVMIEHHSAINFHQAMAATIYSGFSSQLRIGWNASFSFDMSLKGFLQLLSGHCLVIIPQQVRASGSEMMTFLRQQKIDAFDTTPSQLKMLIAEGLLEDPHPRTVLLGGEPVDAAMWAELSNSSTVTAYNMYGPTECTVDATITPIAAADETPHIGRPIMNMRIYLLDSHSQPVPLGTVGEVYIGGAGVARGYLNRPELTTERFLVDPFCDEPKARMYKTGDLARYLPDGNLVYMGRNDQQVKIRGFRIELGEIEARLAEHPLVEHAAVIVREDTPGDKRLAAYYTTSQSQGLTAEQLRTHLAALLPDYMVPAAFVHLEFLPLTPNGKLDRKALPAPEGDAFAAHAYEPPQGETEIALAEIWMELLHLERVGRNDNFFELGGHSLLAIQLLGRLRQRFTIPVTLRDLYDHPDLYGFSMLLPADHAWAEHHNLISIRPHGPDTPLFLLHAGGGGIDYARVLAPSIASTIPLYALEATGLLPDQRPLTSVMEMAKTYIHWIRTVQKDGPYRIAGWSAGGVLAYELARQLTIQGERIDFVGMFDTYYPNSQSIQSPTPPEHFDEKEALLERVSSYLDEAERIALRQISLDLSFDELVGKLYGMRQTMPGLKRLPELDVATIRSTLRTRDAIKTAVAAYKIHPIGLPVWLFEATETSKPCSSDWLAALPDDVRVIKVPGSHMSMMERPEHLRCLGTEITRVLQLQQHIGPARLS